MPWWEFRYALVGQGGRGELGRQRWRKLVARLAEARGGRCQACGATSEELAREAPSRPEAHKLELHHRYYLEGNSVWDYRPEAFWVLCSPCHRWLHSCGKLRSEDVTLAAVALR